MKSENEIKMKKNFNFAVILKTLNMNTGHFWGQPFFAKASHMLFEKIKRASQEYSNNVDGIQHPLKCILFNQELKA